MNIDIFKNINIDKYFPQILKLLYTDKYTTSIEISNNLKISEKTARIKINELSKILNINGASIESKKGLGYIIKIHNEDKYNKFFNTLINDTSIYSPRIDFLLIYLIFQYNYIKIEQLKDLLFVSRNIISKELKCIDEILKNYNLKLDRKPNYGVFIVGEEFRKRILILEIIANKNYEDINNYKKIISDFLFPILTKNNIVFSNIYLENFYTYIYISIKRIKNKFYINNTKNYLIEFNRDINENIKNMCINICYILEEKFNINFNESEIYFLAVYLNSHSSSSSIKIMNVDIDLEKKIEILIETMFDAVLNTFQIDYNQNSEIKSLLIQHMIPLHHRLTYNIKIKNSLLNVMKTKYPDCYAIANYACIILKNYYNVEIPEDEIGYFTMLFALDKEMKEKNTKKKNILIINTSGKSLSKLFIYKYKKSLDKYINTIYEQSIYEIDNFDFSKVDYIFTTENINKDFSKPVFDINILLENNNLLDLDKLFKSNKDLLVSKYYKKELFISNIKQIDKKEILEILFNNCKKYYNLNEDFYKSVLKREEFGTTDFLDNIAILHPNEAIFNYSFVSIGVLENPVFWGKKNIQIVFLICIAIDDEEYLEKFYNITTPLLFNEENIKLLLNNPCFETLYLILTSEQYSVNN